MNYLPQPPGEIISALECSGPLGNAGADLEQFVDEGDGAPGLVGRDEVANRFQIFEGPRP